MSVGKTMKFKYVLLIGYGILAILYIFVLNIVEDRPIETIDGLRIYQIERFDDFDQCIIETTVKSDTASHSIRSYIRVNANFDNNIKWFRKECVQSAINHYNRRVHNH